MKQQLIKVINGEVETLIEDEEKIELLNNINRQSKKVTSKQLGGSAAVINNDGSKRPSSTQDTGKPTFNTTDINAGLEIIREKEADLIRKKQILEQADQQKEVLLPNTSKRGSINTRGNTYVPFQDLRVEAAISTTTSLPRKDLKVRACIGDPNTNQKYRLSFVSMKHQIYEA